MLAMTLALTLSSAALPEVAVAPAGAGTVTVVLARPDGDARDFANAVGQALGEASFTLMPASGHSRYIAEVSVGRQGMGVVTSRAPTGKPQAAIGSWGPTVAVPLGSKKTQLHDLVVTTLTVRIVAAADHRPVWAGSAVTAQAEGTPGGAPPAVALKLARAVVAAYPRPLAAPVSVP